MSLNESELMAALAKLRPREPDAEWAQNVRGRCHERLARMRRRKISVLEAAALAALWIYLAGLLEQAAQMMSTLAAAR